MLFFFLYFDPFIVLYASAFQYVPSTCISSPYIHKTHNFSQFHDVPFYLHLSSLSFLLCTLALFLGICQDCQTYIAVAFHSCVLIFQCLFVLFIFLASLTSTH